MGEGSAQFRRASRPTAFSRWLPVVLTLIALAAVLFLPNLRAGHGAESLRIRQSVQFGRVADIDPTAVAGLCIIGVLGIIEAASRPIGMRPEASRRIAHVCAGLVTACMPWFLSLDQIGALAGVFIPLMLLSRKFQWLPSVHGAERTTLGEVFFPLGVLLAALFSRGSLFYVFGMLVMSVSDAAAGGVGERWGKHSYRAVGARKTYEGSAAFLVATVILAFAVSIAADVPVAHAAVDSLCLSVILTLAEAVLGWGVDNAVLPVLAALLMRLVVGSS
jgi:phytol kinase